MDDLHAIVLFDGGQNSTTCLGWAIRRFDKVETISFHHDQRVERAKEIVKEFKVPNQIIDMPSYVDLMKDAMKNALTLTLAHDFAQGRGAGHVVIDFCQADCENDLSCSMGFVQSLQAALNAGSGSSIVFHSPLMFLTKADIWAMSKRENVMSLIIEKSMDCLSEEQVKNDWGLGCGSCPSCKRKAGGYWEWKFHEEDVDDVSS